jgi:ABC-type multidrug transport system ATPase subunit
MGRSVGTFSAGQQQRLVLLTVLLRRPKLIVLDEPTSALDVKMRHELAVTLRRLARDDGIAVLLATHHLPFVSVVSDRIWRLSRDDAEGAE